MPSDLALVIGQISDGLARENRLLLQGRVNDALRQSDKRASMLAELEIKLAHVRAPVPDSLRSQIERMLILNNENASLLQAALAGYAAGKDLAQKASGAAGYSSDGRRVYPIQESTKRHL